MLNQSLNRQRYQGNEYREELNLRWMDFHNRQYDPQLGRFLSIDPMADNGGQHVVSPYHAMTCNPVTTVDPMGLIGIPLMARSYLDAMMVSPVLFTCGPRGSNISSSLGAEWEMAGVRAWFERMIEEAMSILSSTGNTGYATTNPAGSMG